MSQESDNMKVWDAISRPDPKFLKAIQGGRLKGKSDINPQWRMMKMTETFGPVGVGWKYTIDKLWTEPGDGGEVMAFVLVSVCYRRQEFDPGVWSEPVPGVGGSMLVAKEKNGMFNSDEAFKMATTDALGVAMKSLGMAAEIYFGNFDGSKYLTPDPAEVRQQAEQQQKTAKAAYDTGMAILKVAAESGHNALTLAWKTLSQPCRDACKPHWADLKKRAVEVDTAKGVGDAGE